MVLNIPLDVRNKKQVIYNDISVDDHHNDCDCAEISDLNHSGRPFSQRVDCDPELQPYL